MHLRCILLATFAAFTLLAPTAAADFPWDELSDVHWAGGEALRAGAEVVDGYVVATSDIVNATYADAASAAQDAPPAVAPHACSVEETFVCDGSTLADRIVADWSQQSVEAGDAWRDLATRILLSWTRETTHHAGAFYDATGNLLP